MSRFLDGIRVLIVEDDEDNLELLDFLLREHGASVRTARNAAQVRVLLESSVPDLIVSDLRLPDEDGCALLASLRVSGATASIPAVALSGQAEESALVRAAKAGFARYVTKPADLPDILEAIGAVMGRSDDEAPRTPRSRERALREQLVALVAGSKLVELVTLLNHQAPYRFTSILRFDGDSAVTLASFDRERPGDSAASDAPPAPSYCALVRRLRTPFVVTDASSDSRLASDPSRGGARAYCGVPLVREDGSVFGSICHVDLVPRPAQERVVAELEGVARMLRSELHAHEGR